MTDSLPQPARISLPHRVLLALLRPAFAVPVGLLLGLVFAVFGFRASRVAGIPDLAHLFPEADDVAAAPGSGTVWPKYRAALADVKDRSSARLIAESYAEAEAADWEEVPVRIREWVELNRGPLDAWKTVANRTPALRYLEGPGLWDELNVTSALACAAVFRSLEAESKGDLDEAAAFARAALRFSLDLERTDEGTAAMWLRHVARGRLAGLCWNPAAPPRLVRECLDEARTVARAREPLSESFRRYAVEEIHATGQDWAPPALPFSVEMPEPLKPLCRFVWNEPERSRRIYRNYYANVMDDCDLPMCERLPRAPGMHRELHEETRPGRLSPERIEELFAQFSPLSVDKSALVVMVDTYDRTERAHEQLLVASLGVRLAQLKTGAFPATLDELVSLGILESVPRDPWTPHPASLGFRHTETEAVLWSVGSDQTDQGGNEPSLDFPNLAALHVADVVLQTDLNPPARAEIPPEQDRRALTLRTVE